MHEYVRVGLLFNITFLETVAGHTITVAFNVICAGSKGNIGDIRIVSKESLPNTGYVEIFYR